MMDFRTPASSSGSTRLNATARLLSAFVSLAVCLGILAYFTWQSKASSPSVAEEAETLAEEPILRPTQTSEVLYAVDYDRLEGFVDHSSSMDPEAFYYLLDLARSNSPELMREKSTSNVTLSQLLDEADAYRGQIITIKGRLRRLSQFKCLDNPFGIQRAYEGFVSTEGAGTVLHAIVTPFRPEGVPLGQHIYVNVEVTGYFLGWWRHTNQLNKPTQSPVFMASSVVMRADPTRVEPSSTALAISMILAVLALAAFFLWIVRPLLRDEKERPILHMADEPTPSFDFSEAPDDGAASTEAPANGHHSSYDSSPTQQPPRIDLN